MFNNKEKDNNSGKELGLNETMKLILIRPPHKNSICLPVIVLFKSLWIGLVCALSVIYLRYFFEKKLYGFIHL